MAKKFNQLREKMTNEQKVKSEQLYQEMLTQLENSQSNSQVSGQIAINIRKSLLERIELQSQKIGLSYQKAIDDALENWLATH